jgi:hypothetical protein
VFAALGPDEAGFAQLHEDLVEESFGEIFARHDFLGAEHGTAEFGGDAEIDQRAQSVFTTFRDLHSERGILEGGDPPGKSRAALPEAGGRCRKTA